MPVYIGFTNAYCSTPTQMSQLFTTYVMPKCVTLATKYKKILLNNSF